MICRMDTPLGIITLTEESGALTALDFTPDSVPLPPTSPLLQSACLQLEEYFSGSRKAFSLPLSPKGTAFQQRVWQGLLTIPYGESITYAQLAQIIGNPAACRAVGGANGKNPLPILIPCHRVIAAGGRLGGYSCGLERKILLLNLEKIPFLR